MPEPQRMGETPEYAKWMKRLQDRCDRGHLAYPPELIGYLQRVKEARDGGQED